MVEGPVLEGGEGPGGGEEWAAERLKGAQKMRRGGGLPQAPRNPFNAHDCHPHTSDCIAKVSFKDTTKPVQQ